MRDSADSLKGIAIQWIEEGWQSGDPTVVDRLHAHDFVDHDPAGRAPDREGFKEGIRQLYKAFPDFHAVVEDLVIDAGTDRVAVRWTAKGTHVGSFMNAPPTGKQITFKGIEIIRVEGGRIAERWGKWDAIELLQQLGVLS